MTPFDTFMARIREEPYEETHRLVFADWLDENGWEGWGHLIRHGHPLTICPPPNYIEVPYTEGLLPVELYRVRIGNGLPGVTFVVSRGLVSEVRLGASVFYAVAKYLFEDYAITRVVLNGVVRDGTVFRGDGEGDIPRKMWEDFGVKACGIKKPHHTGAGTHCHATEDEFSELLVAYGRRLARLPPLPATARSGVE
jgi:uncharacterized protein (TIGR02996 family)